MPDTPRRRDDAQTNMDVLEAWPNLYQYISDGGDWAERALSNEE